MNFTIHKQDFYYIICNLDYSPIFRVMYTRGCVDTIDSPDDEHRVARNMQRIEINT